MLWRPEEIRHNLKLILWKQSTKHAEAYRKDMLQLKSFEYNQQKTIEDFDDVDGRMRPKDVVVFKFEESKKGLKLKKKVKMKKPKHSWFKFF